MAELTAVMAATSLAPSRPSFFDEKYAARPDDSGAAPEKPIKIRTNFFDVDLTKLPDRIYVYSFAFPQINGRDLANKNVKKDFIRLVLQDQFFMSNGIKQDCVTDWNGTLISLRSLEDAPGATFASTSPTSSSMAFNITWHNQSNITVPVLLQVQIQRIHELDQTSILDFCKGTNLHDCSKWLSALNVLTRAKATDQYPPVTVKVGREKFFPLLRHTPQSEWASGLQGRNGHFSSVRAFTNGLAMNVHSVATAFITARPLLNYITKYEERFQRMQGLVLNPNSLTQARGLDATFKMLASQLQVRYMYTPPDPTNPQQRSPILANPANGPTQGRLKRVNGFGQSARDTTFLHQQHGHISVEDYFNRFVLRQGTIIQHPHFLVVNTGSKDHPVFVPPELLWIEEHQAKRGILREADMKKMLDVAQRPPLANVLKIEDVLRPGSAHIFDTTHLLSRVKLNITPKMKEVTASRLNVPGLHYAGKVSAEVADLRNGSWNLRKKAFVKGGRLEVLGVLDFGKGTKNDFTALADALSIYGITAGNKKRPVEHVNVPLQEMVPPTAAQLQTAFAQLLSMAKPATLPVILVILPAKQSSHDYAAIKTYFDTQADTNTVCITHAKAHLLSSEAFQANIAMKFNVKSGGVNHEMSRIAHKAGTMMVGADVTHPSGGSVSHCPSIAAMVASCDAVGMTYPGSLRLQRSKQEMIEALDDMICERLVYWHGQSQNKKILPADILFYRDGVSESQFAMVKQDELRKVQLGCEAAAKKLNVKNYKPRITIAVCDKRHHTRFFPRENAVDRSMLDAKSNFLPGLLVDDLSIRSPYHFDFYLQSHRALNGTARPCHYFVIHNDMKLKAADLQQITFHLCFTFATALTPISYAAPAYYADRLAERGRCYLRALLVPQHPQRAPERAIANVLATMPGADTATEEEQDQFFSDWLALGHNGCWPDRRVRANPQMTGIARTMFYI
ncbi:hypothetical protein LTS10_006760 [Elasticomyces elasticus]|nr:hypothetical protein LTS10_006760 [Elasticomyces elasticus]